MVSRDLVKAMEEWLGSSNMCDDLNCSSESPSLYMLQQANPGQGILIEHHPLSTGESCQIRTGASEEGAYICVQFML